MPERIQTTIKPEYVPVIQKILEHRPQLKSRTGVIERSLDYYLDSIVRLDVKNKEAENNKKESE